VISEGSCDTEDWSNDAEHSGINYTLAYCIHLNSDVYLALYYCFRFYKQILFIESVLFSEQADSVHKPH